MFLIGVDYSCSEFVADRFFFFQAEDGIRDLVRSRGLGDVYKRQGIKSAAGSLGWTKAGPSPASLMLSA